MNSPQKRGEFMQKHASQLKLNQQVGGEDKLAELEAAHISTCVQTEHKQEVYIKLLSFSRTRRL